ncbi:hypothetical protein [Suipraeoptans intestinalis]|nr:hypothetical protein [Suipraeoptans intestinalis]
MGFDTTGGNAFGIFAGTAVNDTSCDGSCLHLGQYVEAGKRNSG